MARRKPMWRVLLVALPTLLSNLCTSIPVGTPLEDFAAWKRQHGGVFSVRGMAAFGDRAVHPRLEIRELEKDKDQWNVFLLGLQRFQNVDQNDPLSYFQIAGIHGMPFQAWHRPFLALVEEIIYLNARQAISEFPEGDLKSRYSKSLSSLRLPYWDWAAVPPDGQSCYPSSVQSPTTQITLPTGPKNISNPLFAYTFHPLPDWTSDPEWQASPSTVRQPAMRAETYTAYDTPPTANASIPLTRTRMVRDPLALSRNSLVAQNLDRNRHNIQLRVYNLLAFEHDYLRMSSEVQGPNNIENIHGTIHNTIGGSGHMWNLRYSAYDPVFWLHHANVDRLFAVWQELNANYTVPAWRNTAQTYTMPGGEVTDGDTPLKPFHSSESGAFWTSHGVRNTTSTFAYTYAILQNLSASDSLIHRINALYSPSPQTPSPNASPPRSKRAADVAHAVAFGAGVQYSFSVRAEQRSLGGSPSVFVYLGGVDGAEEGGAGEGGEEQPMSFVGRTSFVMQNQDVDAEIDAETNGNVASSADPPEVQSVVPLTAALEDRVLRGALGGMGEGDVGTYLRRHLSWRIAMATEKNVTNADVSGFEISVMWREVVPALSLDEFPEPLGEEKVLLRRTVVEAGEGRFV